MNQRLIIGTLAVAAYLTRLPAAMGLSASLVDRAQQATALVDVNTSEGRAFGSAFCISDTGLFATDAHVVAGSKGDLKIVIRPGEKEQRVVAGHVLGINYEADLAIVQADNPGKVARLDLGNSDTVTATQEVTAFGYPFGNMLALDKDSYPSVTVNSGKVTALRKEKGELTLIQVDALVNPGNSGGPVLNSDGKVIGLVESGVPGAGLNFATPVAKLKKMLEGPLVVIDPLTVDYTSRNSPQTFSIHANSLLHTTVNYDVDFKITDSKGGMQLVSGKTLAGKCDLRITPTTDTAALKWNPFTQEPPSLKFVMTLKQSGKIMGTQQGAIFISNIPLDGPLAKTARPRRSGGGGGTVAVSSADWPKENPLEPLPAGAQETPMIGAAKTNEFREIGPADQLAIGVEYIPNKAGSDAVISNMRLLYAKPGGERGESVMGRDGYAVGGLVVGTTQYSTGVFVSGFRVIFIRQKGGVLDPSDTYLSDWAGVTPRPSSEKQLAGNGEKVIGIRGRKGIYVRAIGLVTEKPSGIAATSQPASK